MLKTYNPKELYHWRKCFLAYLLWGTSSIAVRKYTIKILFSQEFEGLTILHLSDLHSKWFGEKQNRLLKTINKEHFDLAARIVWSTKRS